VVVVVLTAFSLWGGLCRVNAPGAVPGHAGILTTYNTLVVVVVIIGVVVVAVAAAASRGSSSSVDGVNPDSIADSRRSCEPCTYYYYV